MYKREKLSRNFKSRKTQSELIITILLILLGITAVFIVASFVLNLVRSNLKGVDCLEMVDQLRIKTESEITYFNLSNKVLVFSIVRGNKEFNLTGVSVVYGNKQESKSIDIMEGMSDDNVLNASFGKLDKIILPKSGETRVFRINTISSGIADINLISIAPILSERSKCEKVAEAEVNQVR